MSKPDFSWSFSAYSTAVVCLQKFKYTFVDKLVPDALDSGDLLFGSALHSAVNACLTGEDGSATFEIYWGSYREREIQYGRYNWAELARIGGEFIRKFAKMHAHRYELQTAEKRMYAEYKGVKLEGTPDFYGKYDGRVCLRDFKTSGQNYAREKGQIALQLNLYVYLCSKNGYPLPETLGYTVFNKGTGSLQDLTFEFNEGRMYEMLDSMVEYTTLLSGKGYPKNVNNCFSYNRKCEFFDLCHK